MVGDGQSLHRVRLHRVGIYGMGQQIASEPCKWSMMGGQDRTCNLMSSSSIDTCFKLQVLVNSRPAAFPRIIEQQQPGT